MDKQEKRKYMREYMKEYYNKNKEKINKYGRDYYKQYRKDNKETIQKQRKARKDKNPTYHTDWYKKNPSNIKKNRLKTRYGISLEQYNEMLVLQESKCAICGTTEPGGKGKVFHIDHNHKTGKVRGLLCRACNMSIGGLKDDANLLRKAADYLDKEILC